MRTLPLSEVLEQRSCDVEVGPDALYRFAGIKSFGNGVFPSVEKLGSEFSYRKLTRLQKGDLVYGKLMAWEGGIGIVPEECDGRYVSPEYPVFEVNESVATRDYLAYYFRSRGSWDRLARASSGTNVRRRRVHPSRFLKIEIPAPPVPDQVHLTSRLDSLFSRIDRISRLISAAGRERSSILTALAHRYDLSPEEKSAQGWQHVPVSEVLQLDLHPEKVHPLGSYPNLGIYSFGRGLFHKPDIAGQKTSASRLFRVRAGQFIYSRLFAFEGAFALVPEEFDGSFVSNEFPTFSIEQNLAVPEFLLAYFRSPALWERLSELATGLGNRRQRVKPEVLLAHEVALPPIPYQMRLAQLAQRVATADSMVVPAEKQLSALSAAALHRSFADR